MSANKVWSKVSKKNFGNFENSVIQDAMDVDNVWDDTELIKMYEESIKEVYVGSDSEFSTYLTFSDAGEVRSHREKVYRRGWN